jgi:hypothetical protein
MNCARQLAAPIAFKKQGGTGPGIFTIWSPLSAASGDPETCHRAGKRGERRVLEGPCLSYLKEPLTSIILEVQTAEGV